MDLTKSSDIVDFMVKNLAGETSEDYGYANRWAQDTFRTRLEIFLVQSQIKSRMDSSRVSLIILGSLLTLPYLSKFSELGIEKIFYRQNLPSFLEVVFVFSDESVKLFALSTLINLKLLTEDLFQTCLSDLRQIINNRTQQQVIYLLNLLKPGRNEIYEIFMNSGARRFVSNSKSPLLVDVSEDTIQSSSCPQDLTNDFIVLERKINKNLDLLADALSELDSYADAENLLNFLVPIFRVHILSVSPPMKSDAFHFFLQGVVEFNLKHKYGLLYQTCDSEIENIFCLVSTRANINSTRLPHGTLRRIQIVDEFSSQLHRNYPNDSFSFLKPLDYMTSQHGFTISISKNYLTGTHQNNNTKLVTRHSTVIEERVNIFSVLLLLVYQGSAVYDARPWSHMIENCVAKLKKIVDTKNSNHSLSFFLFGQFLSLKAASSGKGRLFKMAYRGRPEKHFRDNTITALIAYHNSSSSALIVNIFENVNTSNRHVLSEIGSFCKNLPQSLLVIHKTIEHTLYVNIIDNSIASLDHVCKFNLLQAGKNRRNNTQRKMGTSHHLVSYQANNILVPLKLAQQGRFFGYPDFSYHDIKSINHCSQYASLIRGLLMDHQDAHVVVPYPDFPCILGIASASNENFALLNVDYVFDTRDVGEKSIERLHKLITIADQNDIYQESMSPTYVSWTLFHNQTFSWVVLAKIDSQNDTTTRLFSWCSIDNDDYSNTTATRTKRSNSYLERTKRPQSNIFNCFQCAEIDLLASQRLLASGLRRCPSEGSMTFDVVELVRLRSDPLSGSAVYIINLSDESSSIAGGSRSGSVSYQSIRETNARRGGSSSTLNFLPGNELSARYTIAKRHIGRLAKFSNWLMLGKMGTNILSSIYNGDIMAVTLNTIFLGGVLATKPLVRMGIAKSASHIGAGRMLLGKTVIGASAALPRFALLGLVTYDLVNQIESYQAGNERAMVNIVGDISIIAIESVALVVCIAGLFWASAAALSVFLGPIATIITTLIFIGVEIYQSVAFVNDIMQHVDLDFGDRLKFGFLDFVGFHTCEMTELTNKPKVNKAAFSQAKQLFDNIPELDYAFLSAFYDEDQEDAPAYLNVFGTELVSSRLWPNIGNDYYTVAMNPDLYGPDDEMEKRIMLKSKNIVGWSRMRVYNDDEQRISMFLLSSTKCEVIGFGNIENHFILEAPIVKIIAGKLNDVFILKADLITGIIDGGDGEDILDLTKYIQSKQPLSIDLTNSKLVTFKDGNKIQTEYLSLVSIERVIGRNHLPEKITVACETTMIDSRGGTQFSDSWDSISLSDRSCEYNVTIVAMLNTIIFVYPVRGYMGVVIPFETGPGTINIQHRLESPDLRTDVTLISIDLLDIVECKPKPKTRSYDVTIKLKTSEDYNIRQLNFLGSNYMDKILIPDANAVISINRDTIYVMMISQQAGVAMVEKYSGWADKIGASMTIVCKNTDEKVMIGHGQTSSGSFTMGQQTNVNFLQNDPEFVSHLVGGSRLTAFVIREPNGTYDTSVVKTVHIYNYCHQGFKNTLNLLTIENWVVDTMHAKLVVLTEYRNPDLHIVLHLLRGENGCEFARIILKDIPSSRSSSSLGIDDCLVIQMRTVMTINQDFTISPVTIELGKKVNLAVFSDRNVEKNTKIRVYRSATYCRLFKINKGNSMLVLDPTETKILLSIYLEDFDNSVMLQSLTFHFDDKTIRLADIVEELKNAPSLETFLMELKQRLEKMEMGR